MEWEGLGDGGGGGEWFILHLSQFTYNGNDIMFFQPSQNFDHFSF